MASPPRTSADLPPDDVEWGEESSPPSDVEWGPEEAPQAQAATSTKSPMPVPVPDKGAQIWATLKAAGEASGLVPRGVVPDGRTARGALATGLNGYALQWADELAGQQAEQETALENIRGLHPRGEQVDPRWAYRNGRDKFRAIEADFRAEHPAAAFALTTGSSLMNPLGAFAVEGGGALNLARYAPSAAQGAVSGAGATDEADGMGEAAAIGAPLSAAGQMAGEFVGDVAGGVVRRAGQSRLVTGIVQPSKAAQYLRSKHVGGLTVGQMAPDSWLAQLEEASTSAAGVGPAIKAQRDVARQQWQQAVLREALPPGQTEAVGDGLGEQMASIFGGFGPAYDVAKGHAIDPRSVQAALQSVDDPSIYASDATREQVGKFIKDQMTALRLRPDGAVDSGEVMALRSFLRQELRNLPDDARQDRALFQAAVDTLSGALDTELPGDAATALRAADMQYAKTKTVADAVGRSRDQVDGFTTKQLSTAVAQNTPTPVYQQGGGGELRTLASAGEKALAPKIAVNGGRLLSAGPVPYVTGPLAYAMNLPGPKSALLGQTGIQQSIARGAAGAGAALGPAGGRLGAAAEMTWRAGVERGDQKSTSAIVESLATQNPEALGPYAQQIQQAAADGNLPLVHYTLQQTDPKYRAMIEAARTGGTE